MEEKGSVVGTLTRDGAKAAEAREMKFPASTSGWCVAALYLGLATLGIADALTCTGWLCDLSGCLVTFPSGVVYLLAAQGLDRIYVFDRDVFDVYSPCRNFIFLIPAVTMNAVLCYWAGRFAGKLFSRK